MSEHSYLFTYVNDQDIESFLENNDSYFYNINFLGTSGLISTQGKIYGDAISTETMSYINDKFELSYSYILDLNYSMNETSYVINKAIISLNSRLLDTNDRLETAGVWKKGTGTNAVQTKNTSNIASGDCSVAEGTNTIASGVVSHAEGNSTQATGSISHAEGHSTQATGKYSHAEGYKTRTDNNYEHASGIFNVSHTNTLFSVGNGNDDDELVRQNAFEIMRNGDMYIYGVYEYDGQTINSKKTLQKFLELTSISNKEYNNIFGVQETIDVNSDLLACHLIIDDNMEMAAEDNGYTLEEYIQEVVDDVDNDSLQPGAAAVFGSSNIFEWTGDTIEIDGETYNVWAMIGQSELYGLTETTLTLQECIDNSMAEDSSNAWSPFVSMMRGDYMSDNYDPQEDYQLIYVKQYDFSGDYDIGDFSVLSATLYLDNFDYDEYNTDYYEYDVVNIREYIDYYYDNWLDDGHSTECTYAGETVEIDGEEYYLWHCENQNGGYEFYGAMRMDMTATELKEHSKYQNPFSLWCPFEYILDEDNEINYQTDVKDKRRCLVAIIGA